ncbi:MAG TPA: pitrilysin family protein [Longimicrobium sp.]|jgi:predicted Zn-dependent peptidase|nr:pitrilysin family protein [Longimicrobium sp.]
MQIPIERYELDNGLRVVLSEDHTNPVVAVNLWYNVGSRNELPGRTGLAHLFEHMMFQGSQHVPETGHIAHVERVGGNLNASTWLDRTNFYDTVPSDRLELVLWLESDRLGWYLPALTQEKLDNQRDVVKNERRQRVDNQPYGDWDERLQGMLFPPDHPYHHAVIGSMEDLDAASLDDVADFFRTYYAPNNAVLTLCGDFDPAEARRLIECWFGPIPRGPAIPPLPGRPVLEPFKLGSEVRHTSRGGVPLPRVFLAWRIPVYGSPDYYAADVASELLASGKSARLYRRLVREQRLARSVAAFLLPVVTGSSAFIVRGNVPAGEDPAVLERALLDEVERLATELPEPAEMERAITGLEARHLFELQKVNERADQISMLTTYFDAPELISTELDRYRAVTAEDVRRVAADFLTADNRVVLTYVPDADASAEAS